VEWHSHENGTTSLDTGRGRVKKRAIVKNHYRINNIMPNPIPTSIIAMIMNMITARIEIASAFSHPQSKKCFTSKSQSIS